jgi:HrpA-like RNA helicase
MATFEFRRRCKQHGCNVEFVVSGPSLAMDKVIGFSEPEYCPEHRALHGKSYSRMACHHLDVDETVLGRELVLAMEQGAARGEKIHLGAGGIGQLDRELRPFQDSANPAPVTRRFPIDEMDGEILEALEHHQVLVLVGPTGSGKSTHVPHLLLRSKWSQRGPIVVTQPRIQATIQVPRFVARLNNSSLGPGAEIGFTHSKATEYDRRTRLLFMTDGKLINDIVSGAIANYSVIMIDEAHERSVNIDLILGLLKEQLYLYPNLRVIIASATIDHDAFIGFFGGAGRVPLIRSEGRTFPVEERFWGDAMNPWWREVRGGTQPERADLPEAIADLVDWLCRSRGSLRRASGATRDDHILVFMPGQREIDATVAAVEARGLADVLVLPLYSRRPLDEQDRALDPKDFRDRAKRRVVVSTNVAETSLTVEGVRYVIDSGYIKQAYWNPGLEVSELLTVRHSQDGCRQRWGRAGRLTEGEAYLFYTREEFDEDFPEHSAPDIARASLEQVVLAALAAGVRDIRQFAWMPLGEQDTARFERERERALAALTARRAIDEKGRLTAFGLELRGIPSSLDIAAVFGEADRYALGVEGATLLPFLKLETGIQGLFRWDRTWTADHKWTVRQFQLDLVYGCEDDLELYFKIWVLWEAFGADWADRHGLDSRAIKDQIEVERHRLLGNLEDRRKDERRSILIEKLNAFRALMAHCLPYEVYTSAPAARGDDESLGFFDWESYCDATDHYVEYDDDVSADPECVESTGEADIVMRVRRRQGETDEEASLEFAPVSVVGGRTDLTHFVVCQRRANFLRPARARVLGFNVVKVDPAWLSELPAESEQAEIAQIATRARLFASLSRERPPAEHRLAKTRLLLPWLLPRGTSVVGKALSLEPDGGVRLEITFSLALKELADVIAPGEGTIEGELQFEGSAVDLTVVPGDFVDTVVVGYALKGSRPILLVARQAPIRTAFDDFANRYGIGSEVEVEMVRMLRDPLGQRPVFLVRECTTGLEIPMAAGDFCGGTRFHAYFGLRFLSGDRFRVTLVTLSRGERTVQLSRLSQLLDEYRRVLAAWDQTVQRLRIARKEAGAVYLELGSSPSYVVSVRSALWPTHLSRLRAGDSVEGRVRRYDRGLDATELLRRTHQGKPLPAELDLGIEVDLRLPPAFKAFTERYGGGVGAIIFGILVDRPFGGGLLVDLGRGLGGVVYDAELGLDGGGRLLRPRDYPPGTRVDVRVTKLQHAKVRVECSIFRVQPLPINLKVGNEVEVRILRVRQDRSRPERSYVTGSVDNMYRIETIVDDPAHIPRSGDVVPMRIQTRSDPTAYLRGSIL